METIPQSLCKGARGKQDLQLTVTLQRRQKDSSGTSERYHVQRLVPVQILRFHNEQEALLLLANKLCQYDAHRVPEIPPLPLCVVIPFPGCRAALPP